jgi:hypothetical protein
MDEDEKYRLSCGTGAGTTKTPYSERRTQVTIVEEKLQVKRYRYYRSIAITSQKGAGES